VAERRTHLRKMLEMELHLAEEELEEDPARMEPLFRAPGPPTLQIDSFCFHIPGRKQTESVC